jgi:hypothetical protein
VAFTFTSLGSVGNTNAGAASVLSCSVFRAPNPDTLILVGVGVSDTVGTPVQPVSVTGGGITWEMVGSSQTWGPINPPGNELHNTSLWKGVAASTTSSLITATFPNNVTGVAMLVTEVSGSTRVGQVASSMVDGGSSNTVFAPAAIHPSNAWFSLHNVDESTNVESVGQNFTSLDSVNYITPSNWLYSAFTTLSGATMVEWGRAASSENRAGFLVEILDPASAANAGVVAWLHQGNWVRGVRSFAPRVRPAVVEPGRTDAVEPYLDTTEV